MLGLTFALVILPAATPQASSEAADLLSRMLVTDPAERADVASIMAHPWFRRDLDPRLAGLNDALLAEHATWPLLCRSCATSNEVRASEQRRVRITQSSCIIAG